MRKTQLLRDPGYGLAILDEAEQLRAINVAERRRQRLTCFQIIVVVYESSQASAVLINKERAAPWLLMTEFWRRLTR